MVGKRIFAIFSFVLLLHSFQSRGQQLKQLGEFGFGVGTTNYVGDLSPKYNLKFQRPAANLFFRRNLIREFLVLKPNIMFGQILADETKLNDPYLQNRGLSFSGVIGEFSLALEYNFFDFRSQKEMDINRIHSPYVFGGIAVSSLVSGGQTSGGNFWTGVTYGVGMKIKISHTWNVGGDFGVRHTFSDDFDGYTNNDLINTSAKNDSYFFGGIYLSKTLLDNDCPIGPNGKKVVRR